MIKKFFDVKKECFLEFDTADIIKKDHCLKIKSKYYFVNYNKLKDIHYIFDIAKTQKDLNCNINPVNKYLIEILFDNAFYSSTYNVRKHHSFPDTYTLNVGDKCIYGAWNNCSIVAKDNRGYYYVKCYPSDWTVKKNPEIANNAQYVVKHWRHIFPDNSNPSIINFERSNVNYSNMCIGSVISKYFDFGIDVNPEYQRGSVWTEEQKILLIDSIYRNINIGSLVLVEKQWFDDKHNITSEMYEILDGKQRLSAIIDYVSSKFPYKGKYYYELSEGTRNTFENQSILLGILVLDKKDNIYNRKKVIEQFIRLNECGTTMEKSIIDKAKEMI